MVKVMCLLAKAGSGVGLSFGVRALTQMEIRCVKGMFRLKLISSEKNSVFKGLIGHILSYQYMYMTGIMLAWKRQAKRYRISSTIQARNLAHIIPVVS